MEKICYTFIHLFFWGGGTPSNAQELLLAILSEIGGPYGMLGDWTALRPRLVHVRQMPYRLHHCFGPLLFIFQMNIITYFW